MLELRRLTLADLEVADHIVGAAYATTRSRRTELRRYCALQPDGWLLALRNGDPVGIGGALLFGHYAYIGLMAVAPAAQRHGIGAAIMDRLLGWIAAQGCALVLLDASPAGAPLYERLGFVDDDTVHLYTHDGAPTRDPHAPLTGMVVTLTTHDREALVALDCALVGAHRRALLDSYLNSAGRTLALHNPAGDLTAYLVEQQELLGPWVAPSTQAAAALLAHALTTTPARPRQVIIPAANIGGLRLLESAGFTRDRTLRHMRRGGSASPIDRRTLYGQGSFATG